MLRDGIRWTESFLVNRLLTGIWVPMLVAVVLATLLSVGAALLDRSTAAWMGRLGWPLTFDAEAAAGTLSTILAVQVAVLTLYFSITLLVLTLAAQSLGARLIERWIARIELRASLVQWAALVSFTLTAHLFAADVTQPAPRLTVIVALVFTLLALGWMGFGYHRLARTAHVDTSIADLGHDFARRRQSWPIAPPPPHTPPDRVMRAPRSGYLGGFDRAHLIDAARKAGGRVAFCLPDGGFVVEGDPLAALWGPPDLEDALRETFDLGDYRSDRPMGPFGLALLVEIATRALSPGINDPYTAATCADWIGHGLCHRLERGQGDDGWFADDDGVPRLLVPESGILAQARPHLTVLHRAARSQPFVAERLVAAYAAARARVTAPEDHRTLSDLIAEVMAALPQNATPTERMRLHLAAGTGTAAFPDAAE
ncbi:DUF2254 family protein [Jannaschia sp. LMIT008]|uniref:DUF2254 family protein n=1 Tax=Jannaschia maritima TaxID=3032585 RepID=UPI002810C8F7|nr:DUF2254 family protein [Jannaschia sp. LMIT008]